MDRPSRFEGAARVLVFLVHPVAVSPNVRARVRCRGAIGRGQVERISIQGALLVKIVFLRGLSRLRFVLTFGAAGRETTESGQLYFVGIIR